MKKFFTLATVALATVMNVEAKQVLSSSWSAWGDNCTVDGNTITFASAWAGAGYWLDNMDLSSYDYIVLKLAEETPIAINYCGQSLDESYAAVGEQIVSVAAGSKIAAVSLMEGTLGDHADKISQVWVQGTAAGTITIAEVYAATEEEYLDELAGNKIQKSDLGLGDLASGWNSSYDGATQTITYESDWAGRGWWLGDANYADFDYVVIDAEPVTFYWQFIVEYVNGSDNGVIGCEAGQTRVIAPLDAEQKAHVKQMYLQGGEGATTLKLNAAYLCTQQYVDENNLLSIKAVEATAEEAAAFNLYGQRAEKNAKGFMLLNGKKIINL